MPLLKEIVQSLEAWAPKSYQESYDNSGLLLGDGKMEVNKALICLDITEAVLDEAIELGAKLVIAHHPILFKGLKKLTGGHYTERCLLKAIKADIALYALHTNLDNVFSGVNAKMADLLGLQDTHVLQAKGGELFMLHFNCPSEDTEQVVSELFKEGAGHIGEYSHCAFRTEGEGSFKPSAASNPTIGTAGGDVEYVREHKVEMLVPSHLKHKIVETLKHVHPYEEVAYQLFALENLRQDLGAGRVGLLQEAMSEEEFLGLLSEVFHVPCVRHTSLRNKPVKKVALCGGSGFFLLKDAVSAGADVFVTSDVKYHDFFEADGKILLCDIGHFESEKATIDLICSFLEEKFATFVPFKTSTNTNPVHYHITKK